MLQALDQKPRNLEHIPVLGARGRPTVNRTVTGPILNFSRRGTKAKQAPQNAWADPKSEEWNCARFVVSEDSVIHDPLLILPPANFSYLDGSGKLKDPDKYNRRREAEYERLRPKHVERGPHPLLVEHIKNNTVTDGLRLWYQDMAHDRCMPTAGIGRPESDTSSSNGDAGEYDDYDNGEDDMDINSKKNPGKESLDKENPNKDNPDEETANKQIAEEQNTNQQTRDNDEVINDSDSDAQSPSTIGSEQGSSYEEKSPVRSKNLTPIQSLISGPYTGRNVYVPSFNPNSLSRSHQGNPRRRLGKRNQESTARPTSSRPPGQRNSKRFS